MRQSESPWSIRHVRRRVAGLALYVDFRALFDEVKDDVVVSDVTRTVERRITFTIYGVHIDAKLNAILDCVDRGTGALTLQLCAQPTRQRPSARRVRFGRDLRIGAVLDQETHGGDVA